MSDRLICRNGKNAHTASQLASGDSQSRTSTCTNSASGTCARARLDHHRGDVQPGHPVSGRGQVVRRRPAGPAADVEHPGRRGQHGEQLAHGAVHHRRQPERVFVAGADGIEQLGRRQRAPCVHREPSGESSPSRGVVRPQPIDRFRTTRRCPGVLASPPRDGYALLDGEEASMGGNKIVVYKEPGVVAVEDHDMPKLEVPAEVAEAMGMSRKADHGVILRNVSTNICGSDQHMVRGRTTAPPGQTLGHEITGEIVEKGSDVQFLEVGRHLLGAVQHRLRALPQLPRGPDRRLPERQPGAGRLGVRLRRHGRLGRRPGRVRAWCPSPTSTCSSSRTATRRWRRSST